MIENPCCEISKTGAFARLNGISKAATASNGRVEPVLNAALAPFPRRGYRVGGFDDPVLTVRFASGRGAIVRINS